MTLGDRVVVMRNGTIQQCGSPQAIYDRPVNRFVAEFIGTPPMNLIPATVTAGALTTSSFTLPLSDKFRGRVAEGRRVIVGIRPEHLDQDPSDHGPIRAIVDVVEPIGHETIVYASTGAERLVAIFDPGATPRAGETIAMSVDAEALHLFDAETQESLG